MIRLSSFLLISFFANGVWANPHVHVHQSSSLAHALRTGVDSNGNTLYLCQAKLFNSMQPGKTWAGYSYCNIPYAGKEYVVNQFSIPNQHQFGHFNWGRRLGNAVVVGKDSNGTPLFLCQSEFNGSMQPGKTWPGYNHCNISYRGHEIITDNYRVLGNSNGQEIIVHAPPVTNGHPNNMHTHH